MKSKRTSTIDSNKHFLELLLFDSAFPIVSRAAGRSVVGTLNAIEIGAIRQHMMAARFGALVEPAPVPGELPHPSVDSRNREDGEMRGEELKDEARAEQGFALKEKPIVLAARAKLVRDALDADLRAHAGERQDIATGRMVLDQMHVGQSFEGTLDFMAGLTPGSGGRDEVTTLDPELAAIGVTLEDVKVAATRRGDRQRAFLRVNREEIIATHKSLIPSDRDGYILKPEQWLTVFDLLPAYQRMTCLAGADRALFRAYCDELENHRRGALLALGNVAYIQEVRRWIREEQREWFEDEKFQAEYREQVTRANGREPIFEAAPAPRPAERKAA